MTVVEAKAYVGRHCTITWLDRKGYAQVMNLHINNLSYVPMYGAYLVGDTDDVCLDKVTQIRPLD